ncbi:MAG: DMT family transporter [Nocardiopsaceae bacterium]|nr:DMT family transporter [Nocardiopsaceae bacterium]
MNALLALTASLLWGSSDFGGGLMSRRLHPSAAVLISQGMALIALLVLVPVFAISGGWYLAIAAAAGVVGTMALTSFYRAMADAPLSLVAPITAVGTAIPVLTGLVRGDHLSPLQGAGIGVSLVGVILASGPEFRGEVQHRRKAVIFAVLAAIGFGVAYTLLALAVSDGNLYGTLLIQRIAGVAVLAMIVLRAGILGGVKLGIKRLAALAAIGISDVVANGSYALAASRGNLAVAAVLASLYPVVTALLARGILAERLRPVQSMGVLAAVGGVVLLST